MGDKRLIIRLFDFKLSDFLRLSHMSLEELDFIEIQNIRGTKGLYRVLETQLEVLMNLATSYNIELNILVPMLDNIRDFKNIKDIIIRQSQKYNVSKLRIGAMIENVHSMNYADEIARNADFISIGTNDLTERITGLSRGSQMPEFQILPDIVKSSIKEIIYKVRAVKPEMEIGIYGEHTNYIDNIEFLSSLNIDYITCAPTYVKLNQELLNISKSKGKTLQKTKKNC